MPRDNKKEGGDAKLFGEINALRRKPDEDEEAVEKAKKQKYFSDETLCGRLAQNRFFEYTTLAVIVFNALYLGYDCDYNARWGKPDDLYASSLWGFKVMDNFFCGFFTVELLIRFFGYKSKPQSCQDPSFLFDLFLVTLMIAETWIFAFIGSMDFLKQVSILRILRLFRLLRMGKLLRYLPELKLIVTGMLAAMRSVSCSVVLLLLVLYVFSIIFTQEYHQGKLADDDEDLTEVGNLFGSFGKSMRHLLSMAVILDDITACTNAIRTSENIPMLLAFCVCVIISSFTIFNMLLGILCEVVEATSDRERSKEESKLINESMMSFFEQMDLNSDGLISRDEFLSMRNDPKIMESLAKLNINHEAFAKYTSLLFVPVNDQPPKALKYTDTIKLIMKLRPGQTVNCCDFQYLRHSLSRAYEDMYNHIAEIEALVQEMEDCQEEEDGYDLDNFDGNTSPTSSNGTTKVKPKSIRRLADSPNGVLAVAPPIESRWHDGSPPPPAESGDEKMHYRVRDLVEKREKWTSEIQSSQRAESAREPLGKYRAPHILDPSMSMTSDVSTEDDHQPPLLD